MGCPPLWKTAKRKSGSRTTSLASGRVVPNGRYMSFDALLRTFSSFLGHVPVSSAVPLTPWCSLTRNDRQMEGTIFQKSSEFLVITDVMDYMA